MLRVNTNETEERVRAEQLGRIGVSLRKSSGICPPLCDDFPVESAPAIGDTSKAEEVASSTAAAKDLFSLFKVKRVLLPFDFTAASVRLLQWLTQSTDKTGIELSVLHAVYPWVPPTRCEPHYPFDPNTERVTAARALLRGLLSKTSPRLDARRVHVVIGSPSDEIVRFARSTEADLVVMASHGKRRLKDLFFTARTELVARRAPCPVLVLPEVVLMCQVTRSVDLLSNCNADALLRKATCPVLCSRAELFTAAHLRSLT